MSDREVYDDVKNHFEKVSDVEVASGKGAQGIKFNKKMFAMFSKGDLLLQFSPDRVRELIAKGQALPFDPGTGKPMKNRVLVPAAKKETWIGLTEESLQHVRGGTAGVTG